MPRIYVNFSGLDQVGNQCKSAATKVERIKFDLQRTVRQLDWDVRYESNINNTANQIARKLEQYSSALESYRQFVADAKNDYLKLDEYKDYPNDQILGSEDSHDFDWKDIIKSFGSAGSIFGIVDDALGAKNFSDWGKVGADVLKTSASIAKDYKKYTKIGNAIGTANSSAYFWKNFFGFSKTGYASTASSASARFYNNLHNTTSPYKLSGIFDSFKGKKGVASLAASWGGLAFSFFSNELDNIEEQKKSNGTMSAGRVFAESVSETVIDTAFNALGTAVVGAAITAITGSVAAPVAVAVVTSLAIAGINTGAKAITGKSATELVSDTVLDLATTVGNAVADGTKAVAKWFGKLSFA